MQNPTLLIVDDNDEIREMLVHLLSQNGIDVESAGNGLLALKMIVEKMLCNCPYTGVLLDISLPGMNGAGCARTIRTMERAQVTSQHRTRIGFISASMDMFDETNLVADVRATLTIQKPAELTRLPQKIQNWLGLPELSESVDLKKPGQHPSR